MTHTQHPFGGYDQERGRDQYPYGHSARSEHASGPEQPQYPTYGPDGRWTPPAGYSEHASAYAAPGGPASFEHYGQQPGYQHYGYQQYGHQPYGGYQPYGPVQPPAAPKARRSRVAAVTGVATLAAVAVIAVSVAVGESTTTNGSGSPAAGAAPGNLNPNTNPGQTNPGQTDPNTGNSPGGRSANSTATTAQTVGIVDIYTRLRYQQAAAAGTGMVIDSNGYVLTNNHVINGSTAIRVVVVSTGKTYAATVVGTAPTKDVAVIKLKNASGLQTANLGNSDGIKTGDAVTGVGNAGGRGGVPSAASGKITALGETITASDETGSDPEKLHGMIVTDAPIQSGDSGGPLYDSNDQIIGMDTAASTTGRAAGFAIPINDAMQVARQIRSGNETSVIHIGYPAFLGVGVQDANGKGALITSTEPGLPAAKAGIVAGDVITALDGKAVSSSTSLRSVIATVNPGDTVSVTFQDASGSSHQASVTLITGPAD